MTTPMNVFRGSRYQKGHGLGSLFSSLLRGALPLLKSGAKYVGKRVLSTGMKTAGDIIRGENPKTAFKKRLLMEGEDILDDVSRFTKKRKRKRNMRGRGGHTTRPRKRKRKGVGSKKKKVVKRLKRKLLTNKPRNKKRTKHRKRKKRSNDSLLF